jgi:hypothetical protein
MPATRIDLKHVGLLMRSHAKYAVRGGSGLTFVLLVVILGLTVAGILLNPIDELRKEFEREHGTSISREKFIDGVVQGVSPVIAWWLDAFTTDEDGHRSVDVRNPHVKFLLEDRPALLSVMFLVLVALAPFLMGFGGFNQLSGDIANRGLRYLLLRTSRTNIVIARLLGTFLFSAVTSFFTIAVIVAFLALRYRIYPLGELAGWGVCGWAVLNLFSLPYLALCTWVSTAVASPFAALAVAQMAIGVPIVGIKYAKILLAAHGNLDWLDRLTPWGWKFDLLHPDLAKVALAAAVMIGFFLLFALLGMRQFVKRDL